jgi:hypothetical protein
VKHFQSITINASFQSKRNPTTNSHTSNTSQTMEKEMMKKENLLLKEIEVMFENGYLCNDIVKMF